MIKESFDNLWRRFPCIWHDPFIRSGAFSSLSNLYKYNIYSLMQNSLQIIPCSLKAPISTRGSKSNMVISSLFLPERHIFSTALVMSGPPVLLRNKNMDFLGNHTMKVINTLIPISALLEIMQQTLHKQMMYIKGESLYFEEYFP